jgi:hypothetical protein
MAGGDKGPGATAAVLWLMILLVFLPIAGAHLWLRLHPAEGGDPAALVATAPH